MSNISLAGNNGTSINFDGAALQSKEEDEYRKEEEQQQNELRALLTNAFDDLIDEDDILSITSGEDTDSRNVSLIRRHSSDSLNKLNTEENKIHELPENDSEFSVPSASSTQVSMPFAQHQQPKFGQHEPLSRTQELPRGQLDLLRSSVESLPNFPFSRERFDIDVRSSAGHFSNRDQMDSDYHSSIDEQQKIDFRGHVYPIDQGQTTKVKGKGQGEGHKRADVDSNSNDRQGAAKQISDRDNMLRQSIEDFQQLREAYEKQQQEQYYGSHGNQAVHNQYQSAEQPYDQAQGQPIQGQVVHHDQGQYYHGHEPVQQIHHDYDPHYHHHFRNIYENRPYHTIGEREETEGGNVQGAADPQYYGMHHACTLQNHHGYYHNTMATQDPDPKAVYRRDHSTGYSPTDHGFYSHTTGPSETQPVSNQSSGHRRLPADPRKEQGHGHSNNTKKDQHRSSKDVSSNVANKKDGNRDKGLQQAQNRKKEFKDNYKVNYKKDNERKRESVDSSISSEHNLDKEFMDQGGDNQQLAQLQILYKARGAKIEELTNELEVVKGESARDIRIMKHQLSVAKGEREGASHSLESVQDLLQGTRAENTQLQGKVKASEAQIETLKTAKEELIKKLKTAESNIETLHQHLEDLGSSDTLTRARHDHELVVSGLQKKYETEIKHLQEQTEKLNEKLQEKDSEVAILQQKLSDAVKQSERDQISRAETINRLSQSLEDSQKRCRNLLETTTSQDMSQMKVQLQQAIASKSISDEICSSLQDEVQDLKEQVQMLESASALGVSSTGHIHSGFADQNDSMADLGIKKTLDYDTPQGTPTINRSQSSTSSEVVSSLKAELERCLVSNKQKRQEVNELKEELRKVKKDMLEYKQRCEGAELQAQEQKKRIADLEYCLNPGEKINAIENRLKKDIDNLKKEKKILLEDVEDLQKRLEEVSHSEEKLTELNRELSQQIADMVKEYDQDRRLAIDRTQRACEQVSETSRSKLRNELTMQFDAERASIIAKYEKEVAKLSEDVKAAQIEADKVKDVYVQLCEEKDKLHDHMEKEWTEKMEKNIQQITETLKKEEELSLLRAGEDWEKKKEQELAKLKEELELDKTKTVERLKEELEQDKAKTVERLKEEFTTEMKIAQEKFENELKTIKDIMEIEKSNELEKANKEKSNELEKIKTLVSEKDRMLDSIKTDNTGLVDMLKKEVEAKTIEINNLKTVLTEKEAYIENLKIESDNVIEKLRSELDEKLNEVEKLTCDIGEKANFMEKLTSEMKLVAGNKVGLEEKNKEIEKLKQDMDAMVAKAEKEKTKEVEKLTQKMEHHLKDKEAEVKHLKKEIEKLQVEKATEVDQLKKDMEKMGREKDTEIERLQHGDVEKEEAGNLRIEIVKNMQKEKQQEVEQLKKEVIRLKLEIDRNETDKQLEIDKVCRVKQAEIENIEKRRQAELERFKKEKRMEMDRLKKEKDEQINRLSRVKEDKRDEDNLTDRVREKLNKEMEEDLTRSLETKVAMSKVVWLEEHRATRQAAIDNAVRLAESELRLKMEEELESKLEQRLEEAKIMWQSDSLQLLDDERQNWESLKEEEVKERLEKEHQVWRNTELENERQKWLAEYEQRLESDRLKWLSDFEERLEEEKRSWREVELETEKLQWTLDWEKKLQQEKESWFNDILEPAKRKWKHEAEEKLRKEKDNWRCMELEPEKLSLMRELEERLVKEKQTWLARELPAEIEKERKIFEVELTKRIEKKQAEWRNEELELELQREKQVWYAEMEKKLTDEKNNWKNSDLPEEIEKERRKWMKLMEVTLAKEKENWMKQELPEELKKSKQELEKSMESEVESKLLKKLETEKQRLQKVSLAVQEARDDWLREYTMEMSINTTSAEASQGLLKEERDSLKQKVESLQAELMQKEEAWLKEKEDLILQKDLDRREALESIRNQTEAEYKQFITEHQNTLDKALKASREQHNKDKSDLEERYLSQIKLIQAREKALQSQLHESLQGTEAQCSTLAELEKDRIVWYEERDRLLQDIADRDSLLGKADVHLSKEIDKLRTELQAAYQRRLESDMASFKQKIESEFNRANNSEQKEKLQLEKQLSEVNTELIKMKNLHAEEILKLTDESKSLKEMLNGHEKKIEEYNRMEGELKKAKELLKGYKDELAENQENYQKLKIEAEELQVKLAKSLQHQEMLQTELQKLQDEKSGLIESVKSIETSYRKDVALYKQKQDEANIRIQKTEQILLEMKHKYRSELESLRKALEAENDVAMNAMKNKMIELQKKHVAIMEEVKKKHVHEKEEILKGKIARGITPQPATGEVEDIDKAVKELRTQYLDTVHKIKGDVLRHITETNVRAAETVKLEMDRERTCTFNQIKEFYRHNVKQILETEIVGANLETKLLAVEEALDNLSSNPSSRSTTPKSDEFLIDERPVQSRSRSLTRDSYNRDAGISPKNQRTVTFTTGMRGRDDRSKTPVNQANTSNNSTSKSDVAVDDPRSPKSRLFSKPHSSDLRSTRDWVYSSGKDGSFDTRIQDNRPVSAKSHRELREEDYTSSDRPLSAKSPRELHLSLREKSGRFDGEDYTPRSDRDVSRNSEKKKSRMLISTRDIHSGRYTRANEEEVAQVARSKSVTSVFNTTASLYRPTSVPDLSSSEDKELKVWTENNNDSYRYTPLRDTLKSGTNLHRSNSKSESDLSIAEKNFGNLKQDYDSNLDLSTGSLTSIDSFFTPRKRRDAGETPTSTPRRQAHRKHYTMHSFPTNEQLSRELQQGQSGRVSVSSPLAAGHHNQRERKNLPLIQFRHGKMQNLARVGVGNSKSPHPEEPVLQRDTPPTRDTSNSNDRHYRPLSVSSTVHMDF